VTLSFLKLVKNWPKNAVQNLAICCGAIWRRKKLQYRCTTTIHHVHKSPKDVLENLLPVWLLVHTNLFIPSRFWTTYTNFVNCCLRYIAPKKFRNRSGFTSARRLFTKKWKFFIFCGSHSYPLHRLRWNFAQPSRSRCPLDMPSLTWIGATSHPCRAKNLIFGLWVNLIWSAVCRFAASCR